MNNYPLRTSAKKGLIFAVVLIFLVLIDFQVMAATMISKALGTNVVSGGIPEVQYMIIFLVLYGMWIGSTASPKDGKLRDRLLSGLVAGLTLGLVIAFFDLILTYLLRSGIDVRRYLSALGPNSMRVFLLDQLEAGPVYHLLLFGAAGFLGGLLKILFNSEPVKRFFKNIKTWIQQTRQKVNQSMPPWLTKYGIYVIYVLIGLAAFFIPRSWGSYNNYVLGLVGLYVILGIGLNVIVGLSGQLMLGFAAFFAMGAYSVALLNAPFPHNILLGFWPSLLVGVVMAVLAAVLLGLPVMGLRGDYLAIVTLGFGEIIRILLKSDLLTAYTGGPRGIQNIQGPTLFGRPFSNDIAFTYIILVFVALSIFIYTRLERSRTGRAWLAVKEDTKVAEATGVNIKKSKLLALCIGAAFAGLAGGIFAARNLFTGPNDHQLMVSMNILSILIVGGMNSVPGIILGAFTLKGLPEILREIENYRLLVFGGLLVFMMIVRPEGLWPATRPNLEAQASQKVPEEDAPETGGPHD